MALGGGYDEDIAPCEEHRHKGGGRCGGQVEAVGGKVDSVKLDTVAINEGVNTLLALARGEVGPRAPGQTDAQRLLQCRDIKATMDKEIRPLRESEGTRTAARKRGHGQAVIELAEKADASIDLVWMRGGRP